MVDQQVALRQAFAPDLIQAGRPWRHAVYAVAGAHGVSGTTAQPRIPLVPAVGALRQAAPVEAMEIENHSLIRLGASPRLVQALAGHGRQPTAATGTGAAA